MAATDTGAGTDTLRAGRGAREGRAGPSPAGHVGRAPALLLGGAYRTAKSSTSSSVSLVDVGRPVSGSHPAIS